MNPDGSNVRQLTTGNYDDREPRYSPDGSQIVFSSDRPVAGSPDGTASGSYNVWVLTLATAQVKEITNEAVLNNAYYPSWSPDGSQITYVDTTHAIKSVAADGQGQAQTLYSNASTTYWSPTTSPDGKNVAYVAQGSAMDSGGPTSVNGGPLTRLFVNGQAVSGDEDVFAFPAEWLSNDTLVYASNGKIWKRNVTSGAVTQIQFSAQMPFNRASYPMKRHDFSPTATQKATGILSPKLSPDGKQVAFVALNQLWSMPIGKKPQ